MCGIGVENSELCYGQLGQDSVEHVWNDHPTLIALRRDLPANLEGICSVCMFNQQCMGSCVADNYHQTGDLTKSFWFCTIAYESNLFPNNRIVNPLYQEEKNYESKV